MFETLYRMRGLLSFKRSCDNPLPKPGGSFCEGMDTKYVTCNTKECNSNFEDDLSSSVEAVCQKASLADPAILPFGDALNTSSCRINCFKVSTPKKTH